jgi:hypothetical protein
MTTIEVQQLTTEDREHKFKRVDTSTNAWVSQFIGGQLSDEFKLYTQPFTLKEIREPKGDSAYLQIDLDGREADGVLSILQIPETDKLERVDGDD